MNKVVYYFFSYLSVAFFLSLVLVPLMRPLSFKLGAVDTGTGRRVHSGIVPRLGGIGIFLASVIPLSFALTRGRWDVFHWQLAGILTASAIVFLIGLYDDLRGARIRNKLAAEVIAAAVIYSWGIRITIVSNPFGGGPIELGWLSLPVTVLWIIVITNAVNLIDGLDGLAAGTGVAICAALFALTGPNVYVQLAYVVLGGSLLGFLRYNFPPASIFMGDSGSLYAGFFLGSASILSSNKATAIVTVMVPIVAFSLPLMDMTYAVMRRYYRGIPLGEADREHIHHKLLQKGLSKRKVLFLLYFVNVVFLLLLLLIIRRQMKMDFVVLLVFAAVAIGGLRMLGYVEFIPIIRELLRNFDMGRKRKFFSYVIRRFRQAAGRSRTLDELKVHLTLLMKEYDFCSAVIRLDRAGGKTPVFEFSNRPEPEHALRLVFPVVGNNCMVGEIELVREMNGDHLLCTAEMVAAISEEVGRFADCDGLALK